MENILSELRKGTLFSMFFEWIFGTNVAWDAEVTPCQAPARLSDYINDILRSRYSTLPTLLWVTGIGLK